MTTRRATVRERFDAKWVPEPNTGCWLWTSWGTPEGYGMILGGDGHNIGAHRLAWQLYRGPIPEGMYIDHMCRVRCCVNPDHLRVVTPRVNAIENSDSCCARHARKTHCNNGHPLSGDNLFIGIGSGRRCLACRRAADRRRYAVKPRRGPRKRANGTMRSEECHSNHRRSA